MDLARLNYNLPEGHVFVAERVWYVEYRPLWYRALVLLEAPAIIVTSLASLFLFPALAHLEPWFRSWLVFGLLIVFGTVQWWFIASAVLRRRAT